MCGIVGILRNKAPSSDRAVALTMMEKLARRGPDGSGLLQVGGLTLGHRRLAILDLSDAGSQPMRSRSGRCLVSFNGEIYNYLELAKELNLEQSHLRSTSDTEILLEAWERFGEETPDHLVGQFAFALFDQEQNCLWLVRDRFGEKPLYVHQGPEALTFASSLQAILAAPWVSREIDREALPEYLSLRYVVPPRTIVSGVEKLPAGHLMRIQDGKARCRRWWRPSFRHPGRPMPRRKAARIEVVERFGDLFVQACERCLRSDRKVGLLLSDGIDSNAIRCAVAGRGITSYTFRMSDTVTELLPIAQPEGEAKPPVDLTVTPEERLGALRSAFASLTEPVGDGSSLATWLLIRKAREHATVFLCGHGGDEVLGGYRISQDRFRLAFIRSLSIVPLWLSSGAYDRFLFGCETPRWKRRRIRSVARREIPAAARYLIHRPLPPADLELLLGRMPTNPLRTIDRLYAGCAKDATDVDRIQEVMIQTFLVANILSFADAVAMDSSAELRMPFLDRDLVEFVLSLGPQWRVSSLPGIANTKRILRLFGKERMPEDLLTRPKRGFNFGNLPELLRRHPKELRSTLLDCAPLRRLVPGVEEWLNRDPAYFRGPFEGTLWALLALSIFCESAGIRD